MKTLTTIVLTVSTSLLIASCGQQSDKDASQKTHSTTEHQQVVINTPDDALGEMKNGNKRFLGGALINTD